jgi:hypothetical protein
VTDLLEALRQIFGGEVADGLVATDAGIWHATPLPVLAAAVPALVETGVLESAGIGHRRRVAPRAAVGPGEKPAAGRPLVLFDAGAGDGRVLAALALGLPPALHVRLLGLECDAHLAATAAERMEALRARRPETCVPRVARGDFLDTSAYAPLGVAPSALHVVFNYPDGNERRLLHFLRDAAGPEARLVILSPDQEPALGASPLLRTTVHPETGAHWTLGVYAPHAVLGSRPSEEKPS